MLDAQQWYVAQLSGLLHQAIMHIPLRFVLVLARHEERASARKVRRANCRLDARL
jgi:hypothetical protein